MPIDPNIALSVKPIELPNPLQQYMQVQQVQGLQNQNRLADLMYTEKQRENDQSMALNDIYKNSVGDDGQVDRTKLYGSVAAGGLGSKLPGIQKQFLDTDEKQADIAYKGAQTKNLGAKTATEDFDLHEKRRQKAITDIAAFNTPQEALASLQAHAAAGDIAPEQANMVAATIPQNPADFPKWQIGMLQRIMSASDAAKYAAPDANAVLSANTSRANNASTNATTRRGQDLVNQRADDANQNSRGVIIQTDTGPMLANSRTGTTQPIIGPDGKPVTRTKALTEFQGKSAAFGDRAMAADKILGELGANFSPAAVNAKNAVEETPLIGGAMGAITNKFMLNENDQRAEQAQRDFINATLRQESGAAIGASEFDNARKQYFPQPGDGPKVLAQKAANRKLVIEGFKRSAGANAEFTPAAQAAPALPTGWSVEVH